MSSYLIKIVFHVHMNLFENYDYLFLMSPVTLGQLI